MTNEIQDLSEYLASAGQPSAFNEPVSFEEGEGADTTFAINNDDEALWAMRRLAIAQRRIDEVQRLASIEIERIAQWVADSTSSANNEIEYFDKVLTNYLVRVREDETDGRKKLDFPDGTITSRVTPDKVTVENAEAFLAWAEANGHSDWVRVKREADVATIKKVVDYSDGAVIDPLTGQIVEGLARVEGGISVTIKVAD